MAKFNTPIITNKGKALITKAQAGLASIQFSKIATGNGSYTGSENLEIAVELKAKKQEFPISSLSIINTNQVSLKSVISNAGLAAGYYIKEIGLYAVDPEDGIILYSITTAVLNQWDYLPDYGTNNLATISLEIISTVSNANTATISGGSGAYALAEDLQQANIAIGLKLDKTGDSKDNTATFTQASTLAVINTGETHATMFGKIKKAIADLISLIASFNGAVLQANTTIYVATTGNDTTGDGTSGNPYATINKALSVIPKNLNGFIASVYIGTGTYTENVNINGFHGGEIKFTGLSGEGVSINGSVYANNTTSFSVETISIAIADSTEHGIFSNNSNMKWYTPLVINGSPYCGIAASHDGKFTSMGNVMINNSACGVGSYGNAEISIYNLIGTGNTLGIDANGGTVRYTNKSISATTEKTVSGGGIIPNNLGVQVHVGATAPSDTTKLWVY